MTLKELAGKFLTPERKKIADSAHSRRLTRASGLPGSSAAVFISAIRSSVPIVVIADDADDAGYLFHDLSRLAGEDATAILPSGFRRSIKYGQIDEPGRILRAEALNRLSEDGSKLRFLVTWPEAIAERVASRDRVSEHTLMIRQGMNIDPVKVTMWLNDNGFSRVDYVYEPGHYALRGSILDVFGYSSELPVRIDFFGDDVDSVRLFNIETQLSEQRLDEFVITADLSRGSVIEDNSQSLLQFISDKTLIVTRSITDPVGRVIALNEMTISNSALIADTEGVLSADQIKRDIVGAEAFAADFNKFNRVIISGADTVNADDKVMNFSCAPQSLYHKNFDLISHSFKQFEDEGYKLFILSDSERQIARLRDIFSERGDDITFTDVNLTLHEGFVDHVTKMCVFTDHQIFDRFHKYTLKSDRARSGKLALSLKELGAIEVGDYIVHIDHGVGKFAGLVRTQVNGKMQEMIKLVYQGDDIVFVSIHALHKLSKYRGKEGEPPRINRIGSGAWNRIKEKTKSKLKDIARDLIRLYAARREQEGFQFSPDSYLQHELEASFIYEDTPDQLTATRAVKADMESSRPMDRLICGDVGFGKTEVAIRAAFKAACDNKQTAVLVPTTVLAYQHYNTFKDRLKDFPVRVDYLSRARTPKQVKQILQDLADRKIDIIVGTHKLIGKTVKFADLGLLIVDEEQKFGVAVKEKLKQLKVNVDTLTMSATPIPRTLQFSLMGARDLSAITTPPANRYPIETVVSALSDDILTEAISFELSRNGQVFIINNRIEGLFSLEEKIRKLVPDARTVIGHGQMAPDILEKTIVDFANHDYDVLLATTIVESGIDMPNVNTIIINNAQNFGLSELHQLRGRVGRSSRKAFAYLLVPPGLTLTPVARRRLQAIENFSDLGSGIHIAMQDLDIRGAGNLLGAEQSGFIADLGYETYQKILKEAVIELKTQEFADELADEKDKNPVDTDTEFVSDTSIESDLELLIPAWYVPQESERINLYRTLDSIEDDDKIKEFASHLEDRFGKIPETTQQLLQVPRLRHLARTMGIEKVSLKNAMMYLYFVDESNRAYYQSPMFGRIVSYLAHNPKRVKIRESANGRRSFSITNVPTIQDALTVFHDILELTPV
jgi:transcription-repair coupling factor (superfamily II helicase)